MTGVESILFTDEETQDTECDGFVKSDTKNN
jgi:hypothetical protein